MKRILITGIAGLLGANLAYLLRGRYRVCGVDVIPFSMKDVDFRLADLLDRAMLDSLATAWKPEVIIHCAAAVDVDACERNPDMAIRLNVTATENIANICKHIDARLIYISTDAVYSESQGCLYKETADLGPVNVYAKTKLTAEEICLALPTSVILRTNIYGFNWRDKKSFGEWILYSLMDGKELSMFSDVFFSPLLVNDMAEVIHAALTGGLTGIYNVCASGSISKYHFGTYLKKCFQLNNGHIRAISIDDLNLAAKRQKHMGMDNKKFTRVSGYEFKTPEQSVDEFYRLFVAGYPTYLKKGD